METYTLNAPSGDVLQINVDGYDAVITIVDAEPITRKIELKNLDINFKAQHLTVGFVNAKYVGDLLMNADVDSALNSTDMNYFLNLETLDGNKIMKHCINAVLYKHYGYRCFNALGEFTDYVAPEPV